MEGTLQTIITTYLLPIVGTALSAFMTWLGLKLKSIYQEKADTKIKQEIVADTVQYVEQVFKDLSGKEKLDQAIKASSQWLEDKGIKVTEAELRILIESAVYALTNSFYEAEPMVVTPEEVKTIEEKTTEVTEEVKPEE